MSAAEVLQFWFGELEPVQWWQSDDALDREICHRFGSLHRDAAAAKLNGWREDAAGRLAEILLLDQFSRNIFRDTPAAFACDGMALVLAQEAARRGADQDLISIDDRFQPG